MKNDLTQGNLFKNIIVFTLPYLLSYFLQTLYGMADLFIVGQYNGAASISGVSVGSQIMHMITVMLVGLSMGTVVHVGRYVGSHDDASISKVIGNSISAFALTAIFLVVVLFLLLDPILTVMSVPIEALEETRNYLSICFIGIPFIIAYNLLSAIFRGLGDSKTPMYFIAIACVANIALDYLFIGGFDMKSSGAAYGTIIAQAISVLVSLIAIMKKKLITIHKEDLKFEHDIIVPILTTGLPVAIQDGFIQISFLIITSIANSRGVEISAAVGIVEKIISFIFLVPSSMMSTVSTIASQSYGAGKKELAKKTLFICISLGLSICIFISLLFQFISEDVIGLFTNETNVISLGASYMHSYVFDSVVASVHFCMSGFFVAAGFSYVSFVHNIISIITCRVPLAYLASKIYPDTLFPMGLAAPIGGIVQIAVCLFFFYRFNKQGKI